jgi:uncharacterized damage-inducible protein DinB
MITLDGRVLDDLRSTFLQQRTLAERALAQLSDDELFLTHAGDDDANSVAILMKHVGGNLRSRWTDALTTDGEKSDRNRNGEFEVGPGDGDVVRRIWQDGWWVTESALAGFTAADLDRTVTIRGETMTLSRALFRSLAHTAQHVGQIVLLARQIRGPNWQTLSIPRGGSASYLPPS